MIIYKATNSINGKVYIGLSKDTVEKRMSGHKHNAFIRNSPNIFYHALRKYGWGAFTWEIIDHAETLDELKAKEKYWINHYNSNIRDIGYNMTAGGDGVVGYSRPLSVEHKEKIRKSLRNHIRTKEHMENLRKSNVGKHIRTIEEKQRMSLVKQGKVVGVMIPTAKLNDEIVREIKELLMKTNLSYGEVAKLFGVSHTAIIRIGNGTAWKHVKVENEDEIKTKRSFGKLTEEDVREIKRLLRDTDMKQVEIAEIFGVKKALISKIKSRKAWSHVNIEQTETAI